jgi:hypothetical protein
VAAATTTSKPSESKPGHGYGDSNHPHTGPPGQNKGDKGKEKKGR